MKPPRITLRVNGTRLGSPARPEPTETTPVLVAPARLPVKRALPALSTRPNDYMPDDEAVS